MCSLVQKRSVPIAERCPGKQQCFHGMSGKWVSFGTGGTGEATEGKLTGESTKGGE